MKISIILTKYIYLLKNMQIIGYIHFAFAN